MVFAMKAQTPIFRTGLGQSSHRFLPAGSSKPCIIGGVIFEGVPGLDSDSDGDVVYHALCKAITSLTGVPILGGIARDLCRKDGITDSGVYLEKALTTLGTQNIVHVALSLEGKRPHLDEKIEMMKQRISSILHLAPASVGITTTTGDGLTDFGCGDGVQCLCIVTSVDI